MYNDGISRNAELNIKNVIRYFVILGVCYAIVLILGYSVNFVVNEGFTRKGMSDSISYLFMPIAFIVSLIFFRSTFNSISKQKLQVTNIVLLVEFFVFCLVISLTFIPFSTMDSPTVRNEFLLRTPLVVVLYSPVIEEILFRLFLLNILVNKFKGKWLVPIIISSVLFALIHGLAVQALVFGVFLGLVYLASKNILVPILFHVIWNLRVTLEHFRLYPKSLESIPETLSWIFLILSGVLLITIIIHVIILLVKRKKHEVEHIIADPEGVKKY